MITEEIVVKSPFNLQFRPGANTVLWLPGQDDPQSSRIRDRSGRTTAIDVGSAATDRAALSYAANATYIDLANSANHDGAIDTVKVWALTNLTGFRVGTFYLVSGITYACRASATIGAVTAGAERTFTGLSIEVRTGDYLGCFYATGDIEADTAGGSGVRSYSGEAIDAGDSQIYGLEANNAISLYATGSGANYGTITGATWTRLPSGLWALNFDGTDDIVNCGNNASLDLITGATLGMWVKLTNTPSQFDELIVKPTDIYEIYFPTAGALTTPKAYFTCATGNPNPASPSALTLNVWYLLTATYNNAAGGIFYVNGTAGTANGAGSGNITTSTGNVTFGGGSTRKTPCQIALPFILNTAWTGAEVANIYNQERHLFNV